MQPEDWKLIEQVFNAAVQIDGSAERRRYVEKAVADERLRAEIFELLATDESAEDFLNEPVFTLGQRVLAAAETDKLLERKNFAHYYLLELLGQGGMGTVYLAQDTRLDRKIAIKILSADLSSNQETIARFRQEARAATNIAHPAIAHVYDFGNIDGRYYLAMEYARGRTLRELIKTGAIDRKRAVLIALQIAGALASAHESGVIHRDIKPENIIIGDSDEIKILDFGLAKISAAEKQSSPNTSLETAPGLIMGTSAYMSPEQVRGDATDAATDAWSLAVVLYEMLAGERPFTGKTQSDVRAAILRDEPTLDFFAPPLRRIFQRSFAKDKAKRFQNAREFHRALEQISAADLTSPVERRKKIQANGKPKDRKNLLRPLLIAAAILLPASLLYFYISKAPVAVRNQPASYKFARRLTGSGNANFAAISPDGETAVYTLEPRAGEEGLFVRSLRTGEEKTLVAPAAIEFTGAAVSPDGRFVYYAVKPADGIIASLYRRDLSGAGEAQFVLEDIDSPPGFSPDGKSLAYLKIDPDGKYEEIAVADADGKNARTFFRREMPDFIPHQAQPTWSPDGRKIIFAVGKTENGIKTNEILAVDVASGQTERVGGADFAQISKTVWLGTENAVLINARRDESEDARQIWRAAYPTGETRQLTSDLLDYGGIAVDAAGEKILTIAGENSADLWLTDLKSRATRQVTSGGNDSKGVVYAPDGRIVFSSNSTGRLQLFSAGEDGEDRRQLTNDEFSNTEPAVSPDNRHIAYVSTRAGSRNIWLMDIDGQNQRRLTNGTQESNPAFTRDGKSVVYFNYNSGRGALSSISLETGEIRVLFEGMRRYPAISPDGQWLLSSYRAPGEAVNKLAVFSLADPNAAPRVFEPLAGASSPGVVRWLPDGKAFCYIVTKSGASNLYSQPLDAKEPIKLTNFAAERIYWFDFAPDGTSVIASRGSKKGYVALLLKEH